MRDWRLLDTGCRSAAENMALDDVILECRARGRIPNTIRFLQFEPPAVLVGYHQAVKHEVRIEFCEKRGIDINRRLTGGGAIFFGQKSLGWEVFASKAELGAYHPLFDQEGIFKKMCQGVLLGLQMLGVRADFRPKNDIEVNGRKISGTGGTERDEAFLFQGTLLVDFDVETMLHALRIPVMKLKDKEIKSVKERVTCIKWELGYTPDLEEIKGALTEGFEKAFEIRLIEDVLSHDEEKLLKDRLGLFKSREWIFLERRPIDDAVEVHVVSKTPGGLVRVSLALDRAANVIKSALITGDFFVFPSRAILDLEARLKGTVCADDEIRRIVHDYFESRKVRIPGVTPDEVVELICEAVRKTEYESFGISLTEANHIYTVNRSAKTLFDNVYDVLLLPYCAKLPSCVYRKKDGCAKCGKCSIGKAYELAEEAGLVPITILNFEHLMATLKMLQQNGVRGYIGCCCEGFYCKHLDELEAVSLPGILIDIDDKTCYDLGKEREALDGTFESQTELKIGLLLKLLENNSNGKK